MTPGQDAPAAQTTRPIHYPGHGFVETPVVRRESAESRPGPLAVESMDSTVVVPPHWRLEVASDGILELRR